MTTPRRQHNHNNGSDKWSRRTTSSTTNSGEESVSADLSHCKTSISISSSNLRRSKNNNERRPQRPSMSTTIGSASSSAGAAAAGGGGAGSPHKNSTATTATVAVGYSNQQQQRQRPLDTPPPNPNNARPTAAVVRHACNNKGQCIYHPHIQLRKKTIMGVLGGWKDIRHVCPECVREDIIREFMRREAKEIERMEWILDEMERLEVVESSLNDDDADADDMTTAVDREDETGDDDRVKVVGDVSSSSRSSKSKERNSKSQEVEREELQRRKSHLLRRVSRRKQQQHRQQSSPVMEVEVEVLVQQNSRRRQSSRTLSPKPKDRNGNRQLRRQRTLSPKNDRNEKRQLRRQRTLSPKLKKDRNNDTRQSRRQRTLSPQPQQRRQSGRQRTSSPKKDRKKHCRTLSPKKDRKDNNIASSSRPAPTHDDCDNSDDDCSSSSSFQRKQTKSRAMWKGRAKKIQMKSSDTNDDNESATLPSHDDVDTSNMSNNASNTCKTTAVSNHRHQIMCPLHPTVRMRNDKCSLCCALAKTLEVRKVKREAGRDVEIQLKKSDECKKPWGADEEDVASSASEDEDVVSLRDFDADNSNDASGDSEEFGNDNYSTSKRLVYRTNEEKTIMDTTPVSFEFDEESAAGVTAVKSSTADRDEGGGGYSYEESGEHVENCRNVPTTVQQGTQPKASDTVKYRYRQEEGHNHNEARIESENIAIAGTASVAATPKEEDIEKVKSAAIQPAPQAQTIAMEDPSTALLPLETVTNMTCQNAQRGESLNEISIFSTEPDAQPVSNVQHNLSLEVEGAKKQSYSNSNQRPSRSTTRVDDSNKRSGRSRSRSVESLSFFAALVENARSRVDSRTRQRSRSRSVARVVGGNATKTKGRKKLWTRPHSSSRSRSVIQNENALKSSKGETLVSDASRSRCSSWSRSFTRNGKDSKISDSDNKKSNSSTSRKKIARNRSRSRKGIEVGENGCSEMVSALQKTIGSSPETEKVTKCLDLKADHRDREPIVHPRYKLGDVGRDEDMIIFTKTLQSRSGKGRQSRVQDSSEVIRQDRLNESQFIQSVKELHRLDAVFIRRSDGRWTYAIVADIDEKGILFVVDNKGSTKTLTNETWKWKESVRRIKVPTRESVCSSSQ